MMGITNLGFISRFGLVWILKPVVRENGFGLFYFLVDRLSPLRGPNLHSPTLPSPSPNLYFPCEIRIYPDIGGLMKK